MADVPFGPGKPFSSQTRLSPLQLRKPREVSIVSDPDAAVLDGERRQPCVGDTRTPHSGLQAKPLEYPPVPGPRDDDLAMGLPQEIVAIGKGLVERTRLDEHSRIGGDADHGAENHWRQAEPRVALDDLVEPRLANRMTS